MQNSTKNVNVERGRTTGAGCSSTGSFLSNCWPSRLLGKTEPHWQKKNVTLLMETSEGHGRRHRRKVRYAGGRRRLSICSWLQEGVMRFLTWDTQHPTDLPPLLFCWTIAFPFLHPCLSQSDPCRVIRIARRAVNQTTVSHGEFVLVYHGN